MNKTEKLLIHSILLDYNIQLYQVDPDQIRTEEDFLQVKKAIMGAQFAISNFVEFMLDDEEGLNEGTSMLLGHLLQQNLGFLKNIAEKALAEGEKLPKEFYEKREILEKLSEDFPSEVEEKPRIIIP